jgi:hypothetical protein
MADLFFYTDVDLLLDQNQNNLNDKGFGPIDAFNYRVTNLNTASSNPSAYACCKGSILVQKDSVNGLYNLLLKPSSNLISDGFKVKYIIYKGITSNSFIDSNDATMIAPQGTNALIDSIWEAQNSSNSKTGSSDLPSFKSLGLNFDSNATGLDLRLDTDHIDDVFFLEGKNFASPPVEMGWKIGTFDKDRFGIEVVLDDFGYNPDFKILRTNENIITVPNITPGTIQERIEDNSNRKSILNYLDPVCLFSMGYSTGVICCNSGSIDTLKTTDLFSQVLSKFKNCNKIYLDLRNENGLYYNYYDSYGDALEIDFGNGSNATNFKTNSWPIKIIENDDFTNPVPSNKNSISIFLPEGDNNNPLVYQANNMSDYSFPNFIAKHKPRFLTINYQTGYTNSINCTTHNASNSSIENVSSYIKLYYIRRQSANYAPVNNSVVYSELTHFDNLFELYPQRTNFDSPNMINAILYSDLKFMDAIDDFGFSGMVQTGFCNESNRVIFFAIPIDVYLETELDTEKLATFTGGNSNSSSFFDHVFFSDYVKKVIPINLSSISAKLISLEEKGKNNRIKKFAENIFCLGISKVELNLLNTQLTSFNTAIHPVYLGINSVTHAVDSSSQSIPYSELSLSLKGLDTSSEFLEYTQTNTVLLTNSGNMAFSPDSSFNESNLPDETESINTINDPFNYNVIYRLGANSSGTKWPLYKLDGSPEEISSVDTEPVLLPLGTRTTILKTDYVNVSKMNKRKLKVFLWYSKNEFVDNGFRLGYIDEFARRAMVWPRALPGKSDNYPAESIESFLHDMDLYLFITMNDINSQSAYTNEKFSKYTDFVTNVGAKVSLFRTDLINAINQYPSDPGDFDTLYGKFRNLYKKESYEVKFYGTKNTNIPLNRTDNNTPYYENKVLAAQKFYDIIKSAGINNNRLSIFVPNPISNFTLQNPTLGTNASFSIDQNNSGSFEQQIVNSFMTLFGLTSESELTYNIGNGQPDRSRQKIVSQSLLEANGIIYTLNLKREISVSAITSSHPNVIISMDRIISPITSDWLKSNPTVFNLIESFSAEHGIEFDNLTYSSDSSTGGIGNGAGSGLIVKIAFKKIAETIWNSSLPDFDQIKLTPEAIWLKQQFVDSTAGKKIDSFVCPDNYTWASNEYPNAFFYHHGSLIGIEQSIGILNCHPVLSVSIHEANQSNMFIDLAGGTETHNPGGDMQSIWENFKNSSTLPAFNLIEYMTMLQVNYHLPLVYIHHYLTKMDY